MKPLLASYCLRVYPAQMNLRRYSPFLPYLVLILAAIAVNAISAMVTTGWQVVAALAAVTLANIALVDLLIPLVRAAHRKRHEVGAALRSAKRSDFQITLLQILVLTTFVAVFFAARRYISPPRNGDYDVYVIKQFLLLMSIIVAVGLAVAWRQRRQQKAAEALRLKASEAPMQFETVDGNETIDEIISAVDACPICSAPVAERGECIGAGNSTLETSPGNICWTTCRGCGAPLQGIDYNGGSPLAETAEPNGTRSMRWEAHVTRTRPPDEVSMVVEQSEK
jgi:hypothetical protein